jgi:hypothetical protein
VGSDVDASRPIDAPVDALVDMVLDTTCPTPFARDATGCHVFVQTAVDHATAVAACAALAAHLVKLDDDAESMLVGAQLTGADINQRIWIGIQQDAVDPTIWRWYDGSVAYNGWEVAQPSGDGIYAIDHLDGKWGDKNGTELYWYACEK